MTAAAGARRWLQAALRPPISARAALTAGFGGLLVLLALSGLDGLAVLTQVQNRNTAIRRGYMERSRSLQQIRDMVYLSGTYVRDYLLEPAPARAEAFRANLDGIHRQIGSQLAAYGRLSGPEENLPLRNLQGELEAYWRSLAPVLAWGPEQRRLQGYAFLRDQVFPRRTGMLGLADRIAAIDQRQVEAADQRMASLFVRFRRWLGAILAASLALGAVLATASTRSILHLQAETARHLARLSEARQEGRELSARLVAAQENERKAVSRDLHDAVGQSLSAVLMELRNLSAVLPPVERGAAAVHMETIRRLVERCVEVVRNMALTLRPSMLDDLGLVPALEWQAREASRRTGIMVHVAADDLGGELPEDYKTCIYRVVQEALANSARHSQACQVWITLRAADEGVRLSVRDDGRGFAPGRERGLGLLGAEERVANLGGRLQMASEPGRGAVLSATLPLPGAGGAAA